MRLLVLLVVLSLASLHHSALVGDSPDFQLFLYNQKVKILYSLLAKECPKYIQQRRELTDLQKVRLDTQAALVKQLEQQLIKCRQTKLGSTTTQDPVTSPAPFCPSYVGDSVFNMQFISYNNPTTKKAPGVLCRTDGSPCSISLEICVSPINSSTCEYYYHMTDVVGDKSRIDFSDNLGDLENPVKIDLGNSKWQGAHILITVIEKMDTDHQKVYHELDEFSYDLKDAQGSPNRLLVLHGKRITDKTELMMRTTILCPSSSTTLPTTPTILPTTPITLPTTPTTLPTTPTTLPTTPTTLPITSTALPTTTTSTPIPAECFTATNLTQYWRLDHGGRNFKGGGPYSSRGYACDRYNLGWFRFTGAAGTHMLDTCPKYLSCGTAWPYWTDEAPPKAVGVIANISTYGVHGDSCKFYALPVQVMRCSLSTDHDLIYRYVGYYLIGGETCSDAFCGMN